MEVLDNGQKIAGRDMTKMISAIFISYQTQPV